MKRNPLAVLPTRRPPTSKALRLCRVVAAILLPLLVCAGLVLAFAEESLRFRDPYTG